MVPAGPDQSSATAARFSLGAEAYLRLWAPVLRPHAVRLLDELQLAKAQRILDVGTGVGALLPDIARAAPRASLFGIDIAAGMLALAPKSVPVAAMDAARLGFRPASFEAVVMAFVLFLLPDPANALAEVRRVGLRDSSCRAVREEFPDQPRHHAGSEAQRQAGKTGVPHGRAAHGSGQERYG
jgi:ubiquinone/menaquinone biosynthesis C-methylase UbiE